MIFYREPELAPGVYTMETVVYDAPSGKSSVRLSTVEVVREAPGKPRMSSLVLVSQAEKVPEKERRAENPLLVKDVVISPNLGDAVSKTAKEVGFYFAAYPAAGGPAPESRDRAPAERQAHRANPDVAAGGRRNGTDSAGRPLADRAICRQALTSCAPSSSRDRISWCDPAFFASWTELTEPGGALGTCFPASRR